MQGLGGIRSGIKLLAALGFLGMAPARAAIVAYPPPPGMPANNTFGVQIREPGGTWQDLYVYDIPVRYHGIAHSSMVHFSCSGAVEMKVALRQGTIHSSEIRPASFGITPKANGNVLAYTFTQNDSFPRKFVLRVNGGWDSLCLHVDAHPLETDPPAPNAVTYYFGPGTYEGSRTAPLADLKSGDKVYIAGGARVRGVISARDAGDIWIGGRGFLESTDSGAGKIRMRACSNVRIEGITLFNTLPGWGVRMYHCDHVTVSDFTLFGYEKWNDGIHFDGSRDCTATGCFLRSTDDLLLCNGALDGTADVVNCVFKNMVLWGDKAHILLLGYEGNAGANLTTRNVAFRNLDVINHVENGARWQGVIGMMCTGNQTLRDITYEDVRIMPFEKPDSAKIVHFDLGPDPKHGNGNAIRAITIRNLSYSGYGESPSLIEGYAPAITVDSVDFINYTRNGVPVTDPRSANLLVGGNAFHISFNGRFSGVRRPAPEEGAPRPYSLYDAAGHSRGGAPEGGPRAARAIPDAMRAYPHGILFKKARRSPVGSGPQPGP